MATNSDIHVHLGLGLSVMATKITKYASGTWFLQIWTVLTDGVGRCLCRLALGDSGFLGYLSGTWDRRASVARIPAKTFGTPTAVSVTTASII